MRRLVPAMAAALTIGLSGGCVSGPLPQTKAPKFPFFGEPAASRSEDSSFGDLSSSASPSSNDDRSDEPEFDPQRLTQELSQMNAAEKSEYARTLTDQLSSLDNAYARADAVGMLGEIDHRASVDGLRKALVDESSLVRVAACRALAKQSHPQASKWLSMLAEMDPDQDVRVAAQEMLRDGAQGQQFAGHQYAGELGGRVPANAIAGQNAARQKSTWESTGIAGNVPSADQFVASPPKQPWWQRLNPWSKKSPSPAVRAFDSPPLTPNGESSVPMMAGLPERFR